MNKWLITCAAMTLSTASMAASSLDKILLEANAVDENYVYTDMTAALKVFETFDTVMALLIIEKKINDFEGGRLESISFKPYTLSITVSTDIGDEAHEFKDYVDTNLNTPSALDYWCTGIYLKNDYIAANDAIVTIDFLDNEQHYMTSLRLDTEMCGMPDVH